MLAHGAFIASSGAVTQEEGRSNGLPKKVTAVALSGLLPLTRTAIALGISANLVTALSLLAGAAAGLFLAYGQFGIAASFFVAASLGDALDGLVARATRTESQAGALFDASADRYEEFFVFGGLAIYFRSSGVLLTLTLVALLGSFMVSYGSAKAESLGVTVPGGAMRRAARAIYLGAGMALVPIASVVSLRLQGAAWLGDLPIVIAMAVIALGANVSAVRRLRVVAMAVRTPVDARSQQGRSHLAVDGPLAPPPMLEGRVWDASFDSD